MALQYKCTIYEKNKVLGVEKVKSIRKEEYMVKNTACCCVLKCSKGSNATTVFNSQRHV